MDLGPSLNRLLFVRRSLCVDIATEKNTVFLAGSGRSGTTWIHNFISAPPCTRVLFEPFRPEKQKQFQNWGFRKYISRHTSEVNESRSIHRVLKGRIHSKWIDQDNTTLLAKRRVIKDIRANLFLAWLKENFPKMKIIFLLRHPFSVALSRIRLGWDADLGSILSQQDLVQTHFPDELNFLMSRTTNFERQVAFWAVENLVPLRELKSVDAHCLSYEDLCANREAEALDLATYLGIDEKLARAFEFDAPSKTTWREEVSKSSELTALDIRKGLEILERFSLTRIYDDQISRPPELRNWNVIDSFRM